MKRKFNGLLKDLLLLWRILKKAMPVVKRVNMIQSINSNLMFHLKMRRKEKWKLPILSNEEVLPEKKSVRLPTMFAQFGSLDDENVPQRRPRRRITEIDVFDKFSDIASSVGEDYDKYGPSHWIHEYSSDTDQPELKS